MFISSSEFTFHLLVLFVGRLPTVFVVVGVYRSETISLVYSPIREVLPLQSNFQPFSEVPEVLELSYGAAELQGLLDDAPAISWIGQLRKSMVTTERVYIDWRASFRHFTSSEKLLNSSMVCIALSTSVS